MISNYTMTPFDMCDIEQTAYVEINTQGKLT